MTPNGAKGGTDARVRDTKVPEATLFAGPIELETDVANAVGIVAVRHFRLALVGDRGPRANVRFRLEVAGLKLEGTTGPDGMVEKDVPVTAETGKLSLFDPPEAGDPCESWDVKLAPPPPATDLKGVQIRLIALGFYTGAPSGSLDKPTRAAIREFQEFFGHARPSGEMDDETRRALVELHDEA